MDTDFTVRTIGYHKDTQEADKLVLPALGGDRGGGNIFPRIIIFILPQILTDGHGFYHADGGLEHESHEFHEYFFAHRYSRMDTDFTVRRITLLISHRSHSNIFCTRMDTDEHGFTVRMLFLNTNCTNFTNIFGYTDIIFCLPQIPQMNTDLPCG